MPPENSLLDKSTDAQLDQPGQEGMKSRVLLDSHLKSLKLPTFAREYERTGRQCSEEDKDYAEFLL